MSYACLVVLVDIRGLFCATLAFYSSRCWVTVTRAIKARISGNVVKSHRRARFANGIFAYLTRRTFLAQFWIVSLNSITVCALLLAGVAAVRQFLDWVLAGSAACVVLVRDLTIRALPGHVLTGRVRVVQPWALRARGAGRRERTGWARLAGAIDHSLAWRTAIVTFVVSSNSIRALGAIDATRTRVALRCAVDVGILLSSAFNTLQSNIRRSSCLASDTNVVVSRAFARSAPACTSRLVRA